MNKLLDRARRAVNNAKTISKKLTPRARKKLSKSVFCGPGRSFPTPDCKRIAVAKAYLGRSKFSKSTKKKIAACINRRAKKLGCKVTKKAKASEEIFPKFIELSYEQKRIYSSDDFAETKALVEESIKNPGMELDFADVILCENKEKTL